MKDASPVVVPLSPVAAGDERARQVKWIRSLRNRILLYLLVAGVLAYVVARAKRAEAGAEDFRRGAGREN